MLKSSWTNYLIHAHFYFLLLSPAYRATLLLIRWAQVKTALTFLHFACTSYDITCRRLRDFCGETMGKYGQSYGQISDYKQLRL
jgi:hypothetical protein